MSLNQVVRARSFRGYSRCWSMRKRQFNMVTCPSIHADKVPVKPYSQILYKRFKIQNEWTHFTTFQITAETKRNQWRHR